VGAAEVQLSGTCLDVETVDTPPIALKCESWEPTLKETTLKSSTTPASTAAMSQAPAAARMSFPIALITPRPLVDAPAIVPPSPAASLPPRPRCYAHAEAATNLVTQGPKVPDAIAVAAGRGEHRPRRVEHFRPHQALQRPRSHRDLYGGARRTGRSCLKRKYKIDSAKNEYACESDQLKPAHHRHHVFGDPPSHQRTGKWPRASWT